MKSQKFGGRGCAILLLMLSTIVGTISAFAQVRLPRFDGLDNCGQMSAHIRLG